MPSAANQPRRRYTPWRQRRLDATRRLSPSGSFVCATPAVLRSPSPTSEASSSRSSWPDRHGQFADIVLGFDTLEGYLQHPSTYFGALLGRYASRIGGAAFTLSGRTCHLAANHGKNSLHGGARGLRQAHLDGARRATKLACPRIHQPGRRRGLSRPPRRTRNLLANRCQRIAPRPRSHDRCRNRPQPDRSLRLQPRRAWAQATSSTTA